MEAICLSNWSVFHKVITPFLKAGVNQNKDWKPGFLPLCPILMSDELLETKQPYRYGSAQWVLIRSLHETWKPSMVTDPSLCRSSSDINFERSKSELHIPAAASIPTNECQPSGIIIWCWSKPFTKCNWLRSVNVDDVLKSPRGSQRCIFSKSRYVCPSWDSKINWIAR